MPESPAPTPINVVPSQAVEVVNDPTNLNVPITPTTKPLPELPKKKSLLSLVIIAVGILFVLFVATMLFIRGFSPGSSNPTPTPVISDIPSGQKDPTSDWAPYVNKTLTFQLKTPKDWQVEVNDEQKNTVWLKAPDESQIEIVATDSADLTISAYIDRITLESQTAWEGQPSKEYGQRTDTIVGNFEAIKVPIKYLAAGFSTTTTYAKVDQKIFSFTILPSASGDPTQTDAADSYALVLSTFKKYLRLTSLNGNNGMILMGSISIIHPTLKWST
jgi:hypothetical protein